MTQVTVTKYNGERAPYIEDKITDMVTTCADGLNVSVSQVCLQAKLSIHDGIKTSEIQNALVEAAESLFTEHSTDYGILAGRLLLSDIRKKVFGTFEPPHLYEHTVKTVKDGRYDPDILDWYTEDEFNELNDFIDHKQDLTYGISTIRTWQAKYLMRSRKDQVLFETPQLAMMLIPMYLFAHSENRIGKIKRWHKFHRENKISLPTPIIAGVRSTTKQYSSCCKIDAADSLDSIGTASQAIMKYGSMRAGIGINGGRIRAEGSPIRNGEAVHTGVTNFYKNFQAALHSCSQGGLRKTSGTLFAPFWHLEAETILNLKNNRGTEDNRVRHLDYCIQFIGLFYQRLSKGKDITLFCPSQVPELADAFYHGDNERFTTEYEKAEGNTLIRQKKISAMDFMKKFILERSQTGRIYLMNMDNVNLYSSFNRNVSISMSNLCQEITLPTSPMENIRDGYDDGAEIALCTLFAFNIGKLDFNEYEEAAELLVEGIDNLLDYQNYPVEAAKSALKRRSLGGGVIGLAHKLASHGVRYSDGSANNLVHEIFERLQYSLLKASCKVAKEKGACELYKDTKYFDGILPIDNYAKSTDKLHTQELVCDWESLRKEIEIYGLRNSTLTALMPAETSAKIADETNGIEPPRKAFVHKGDKEMSAATVVPEYEKLKDNYEYVWDQKINKGYLELVTIMQKFVDQSISANTNYNPFAYPDGKVPLKEMIKDIYTFWVNGGKTLYYHNTYDGREDANNDDDDGCSGGACKI